MSLLELILLSIGLAMDAFAVSICKGLALRNGRWKHAAVVGLWFGGFQALMPLIGYLLGSRFAEAITAFDHWIAFGLLLLIGAGMIRESFSKEEEKTGDSLAFRTMLLLAVATSIDALAVGVTFAFLSVRIIPAICMIGCITFVLSALGVRLGAVFGMKYKSRAEIAGGIILILIGIKILLEHLGVL
ncbi:MAG: manganese efflux pump [Oscillospiraceae bacterium]|nr:manganese efflux pump [Oscillospiraceae bacterium]